MSTGPVDDVGTVIAEILISRFNREFGPDTKPPSSMHDPDPYSKQLLRPWREPGRSGFQAASAAEVAEVLAPWAHGWLTAKDAEIERLRATIEMVRAKHCRRTSRPSSGCVQCGVVWPCPTFLALDLPGRPA